MSSDPDAAHVDARPRLGLGLRLIGLATLVALGVGMRDRIGEAVGVFVGADFGTFAAAFALYLLGLFASALRASLWLRAWHMPSGLRSLAADVLAATTLNALTISGAGEGYRVHALVRRGAGTMDAWVAVVGDRLLGLGIFALAAGVGLVWTGAAWMGLSLPGLSLVPIALGIVGVLGLAFAKLPKLRAQVSDRVRARAMPRAALVAILALSVVTLVAWIASVIGLARALGLDAPMDVVAASAPLVAVAAFLPITIGGIGVREAGYALLLAPVGVSAAGGIALGLAQYACFLGVAILGGGVLVLRSIGGADASRGSTSDAALTP